MYDYCFIIRKNIHNIKQINIMLQKIHKNQSEQHSYNIN